MLRLLLYFASVFMNYSQIIYKSRSNIFNSIVNVFSLSLLHQ